MDYQVLRTGKDATGDITSLCGSFGNVSKAVAILEIEAGLRSYFTMKGGHQARVIVVKGPHGPYLKTTPDGYLYNNLDDLPDC